jgi:predicted O-methyltransferase YrrM
VNTPSTYQFTNNWFVSTAKPVWDQLLPQVNPSRVLEIGSYEGASTCYLVEQFGPTRSLEVHCVDTWEGGVEHAQTDMSAVEARFDHNVAVATQRVLQSPVITKHKGYSDIELAKLVAAGLTGYFDFLYVDGSHQAPDVLADAVLGFKLLRVGGVMAFDDYLWSETLPNGMDPIRCPKPAIDAFTNLYCRKLQIIQAPLYQLYVVKTQD